MVYLLQFGIILLVTVAAEVARYFIPLPVPASIYGLIIMLLLLIFKVVRLEQIRQAGRFLLDIMQAIFIPATVGLMASAGAFGGILIKAIALVLITTVIVMVVSGHAAQLVIRLEKRGRP